MRGTPFTAALVGAVLLVSGLVARAAAVEQIHEGQAATARETGQVADAFAAYLDRAKSLDLLQAQSPAFTSRPGQPLDLPAANHALGYLQVLYPGIIGETCLIDERGRELARVTDGRAATVDELSPDESGNPFFAPTLALPLGQVYQASPYVSPDTHDWVISSSTWIRRTDGTRLIVHFEVTLASFQKYLRSRVPGMQAAVIDAATREVFLRTGRPLPATDPPGPFPIGGWAADLRRSIATRGDVTVEGHQGRFEQISRPTGTSSWYVVEWQSAGRGHLPPLAGELAALLGALLVGLALVVFHRRHSTLRAASLLDHLTGLANRQALEEALEVALTEGSGAPGDRVAVLMIDLDGFKQINDSLGHDRGDLVLQEVARRLHSNVFEYDTAARLGGDEFAVVLRRLRETDDISVVANRLRDALVRPIRIDEVFRFVGASIGAASYPGHGATATELLRNADAAMYQAKRGREGVRVYQSGTQDGAASLGLAAALLTAIERDEIGLVFQPEYSLATGAVRGVEALARWQPHGSTAVPPTEFVVLAEETGLIRGLTMLTLRKALDEVDGWRRKGHVVPVSVNLSGGVLGDVTLPDEVQRLLSERALPASALVLEITETAVIQDRQVAIGVLRRLREAGVAIELDDFGSGHASFSALRDLPLDGVKIDRQIVADQAAGDAKLLAATVELAHHLGLYVVAEGIEDEDTLIAVRSAGCDSAQGYHLARPMPSEFLDEVLGRDARPATL